MDELQTKNILSSSIHSFSEFYNAAHQMIESSFTIHKERNLNNQIVDRLTEVQIAQYNFIEIQTFELSKQIKSKLARLNQQQISIMLIKINNLLEEVQKFCGSLKIIFVFQLFQKIAICLTIMASLNCQSGSNENLFALQINSKKKYSMNGKQAQQKQSNFQLQKQDSKKSLIYKIKQKSKQFKKLKLGGISLYNESYKRQIENRQLLIGYFDMINENSERKKFWEDTQRDFKETIGVAQISSKGESKEQTTDSKKQFKQLSCTFSHKAEDSTSNWKFKQIKISDAACHSVNANNIIYNSKVFDYELEVENISTLDFERAIDSITEAYHNQKLFTLESIKKLMKQISKCYQNTINDWSAMLTKQKSKVQDLQAKLFTRSFAFNDTATQTITYKATDKISEELEKLKLNQTHTKQFIVSLEEIISKQNNQILNYEKINMQNIRKLETQQSKISELQNKIKEQQKSKKAKNKNKQAKHKLYDHCEFPKSVKQIKMQFQILAQALEDLGKQEPTQNTPNYTISGEASVKNILNMNMGDNQQKASNESSSEHKIAKLIQFMKSENNIKDQAKREHSEFYDDTEVQIDRVRTRKKKKTIKPILNATFRSQIGFQNKFEQSGILAHHGSLLTKNEKDIQKSFQQCTSPIAQNESKNKRNCSLQDQAAEPFRTLVKNICAKSNLQINSKIIQVQIKNKLSFQSISLTDNNTPLILKQLTNKNIFELELIKQQMTPSQKILMDHHDILRTQASKNKKEVVKTLIQKHLQSYDKKASKNKQNASQQIGLSFYNTNFNDSPNKFISNKKQFSKTTYSNEKQNKKNININKWKPQQNTQQKVNNQGTSIQQSMKLTKNKKLKTYFKQIYNNQQNFRTLQKIEKIPRYSNLQVSKQNIQDKKRQSITDETVICDIIQYQKIKQIYDDKMIKSFGKSKIEKRNTHQGNIKLNQVYSMETQIQNTSRNKKNIQKIPLMKISLEPNLKKDRKQHSNIHNNTISNIQKIKIFR